MWRFLYSVVIPLLVLAGTLSLISTLLMIAALLRNTQLRRVGLLLLAITLAFCVFDWALLHALPWMRISFGPPDITQIALWLARLLFFLLCGAILHFKYRKQANRAVNLAVLPLVFFNGLLVLLILYGFTLEPFQLTVTKMHVPVPPGTVTQPFRIVHLTDIHVERTTQRERELLALVEQLQPDLILMTGDYLNLSFLDDPLAINDVRSLFAQLHAPYGIYAVNGSVDSTDSMQALFTGLDITVLANQVVRVDSGPQGIYLIGIKDTHNMVQDAFVMRAQMGDHVPPDAYSVLLYHTPDLILDASAAGVDLYLAGHTHGGQIRLPFYGAIVTFSAFGKQYEQGRYTLGPTTLYVSRGIGMEGSLAPRVRFLAPPEVVVIDLTP